MSGLNYYEHHLGDHTKATAHITMTEEGAYRRLLDFYYSEGKPIPAEKAHKVARARTRSEHDAVDAILNEFFKERNGFWYHKRVTTELKKAHNRIRASKKNGRLGGRPKKSKSETEDKSEKTSTDPKSQTEPTEHQEAGVFTRNSFNYQIKKIEEFEDDVVPTEWQVWRSLFMAEWNSIPAENGDKGYAKFRKLAEEWISARVSIGQMRSAVAKARCLSSEPIKYLPSYVNCVLSTGQYDQKTGSNLIATMLGLGTETTSTEKENSTTEKE